MDIEKIRQFAKEKLLPPLGTARVWESGRTDIGDYKKALELLLEQCDKVESLEAEVSDALYER